MRIAEVADNQSPLIEESSMTQETKLLPCPFCGAADDRIGIRYEYFFQGFCKDCAASSSPCIGKENSVECWNTRRGVVSGDASTRKDEGVGVPCTEANIPATSPERDYKSLCDELAVFLKEKLNHFPRALNEDGCREIWDWLAKYDAMKKQSFKCKSKDSGIGGNDPQDCAWPTCGCDPYADKVIAALEESGAFKSPTVTGADNKAFAEAKKELAWLKQTATASTDRARVIGYEDCLRKWRSARQSPAPKEQTPKEPEND